MPLGVFCLAIQTNVQASGNNREVGADLPLSKDHLTVITFIEIAITVSRIYETWQVYMLCAFCLHSVHAYLISSIETSP